MEEWRLSQGFNSRLQDNLLSLLFGSSRYADRAPIGLTEIIENAPVERLIEYYQRWYRPDLMAVVAVGDFDIVEMEAKVKQHFAPPPEGEAYQEPAVVAPSTERPIFDVPGYDETRIEVFTDAESPAPSLSSSETSLRQGSRLVGIPALCRGKPCLHDARRPLFERTQSADPPYLWAGSGRSAYVESLDILTFQAWTEPDGIEKGLVRYWRKCSAFDSTALRKANWPEKKATCSARWRARTSNGSRHRRGTLVDEYVDHFFSGTPVPGIEAEWELYQELLPQISLVEFGEVAESWTQSGNTGLLSFVPKKLKPTRMRTWQ